LLNNISQVYNNDLLIKHKSIKKNNYCKKNVNIFYYLI